MSTLVQERPLSPLLCLPAELRLQIYGHILESRTIYVRMRWSGICTPSGFEYFCLQNSQPLLESGEKKILAHTVPFIPEIKSLAHTCRLIQKETGYLPFKLYTWAFETAFALDQWVSIKNQIRPEHKNAIRSVAVPTPGPYRASERVLSNLSEVLLIGSYVRDSESTSSERSIVTLTKDPKSNTWVWKGGPV